jgi:hypothetical protein
MARFDPDAMFHFKRGPRGEILFFPRGSWGRGYVVPNEVRAEAIAHRQKVLYRWSTFCAMLVLALSPFGGWRRFTLFCVALSATTTIARWRLRREVMLLPTSDTRLGLRDVLAQQKDDLVTEVRGTSWWIRVALVVVTIALLMSLASG